MVLHLCQIYAEPGFAFLLDHPPYMANIVVRGGVFRRSLLRSSFAPRSLCLFSKCTSIFGGMPNTCPGTVRRADQRSVSPYGDEIFSAKVLRTSLNPGRLIIISSSHGPTIGK